MEDYTEFDDNLRKALINSGAISSSKHKKIDIIHNDDGSIEINLYLENGGNGSNCVLQLPPPKSGTEYDYVSFYQGHEDPNKPITIDVKRAFLNNMRKTNGNTIAVFNTAYNNNAATESEKKLIEALEEAYEYNISRKVISGFSDGGIGAILEGSIQDNASKNYIVIYDSSYFKDYIGGKFDNVTRIKNSGAPIIYLSNKELSTMDRDIINKDLFSAIEGGIPFFYIKCNFGHHDVKFDSNWANLLANNYLLNGESSSGFSNGKDCEIYKFVCEYDENGKKVINHTKVCSVDEFSDYLDSMFTLRSDNVYLADQLIKIDLARKKTLPGPLKYSFKSTTTIPCCEGSIANELSTLIDTIGQKLEKEMMAYAKAGDNINNLNYQLTEVEKELIDRIQKNI